LYQSGYVVYKDNGQEEVVWQRIHVDHDFCKTYGIDIVSGRDFSRASAADTSNFIINETAVHHLGLENSAQAIGLEIGYDNGLRGKIIGVMRDFHFKTLHTPVEPLIIHIVPSRFRMLSLNVEHADFLNTISWIRNKWVAFDPSSPFVYTLLGDFNERNYVFEKKFSKLIIFFTLVVSVLSASGMIGLTIYIVNLKKKEIGIRKVLGAGMQDLLFSLNRRFAIIAAIGFVLSVPISWFALSTWLSGFAYKINLSAGLFIAAGVIMSVLCIISVSIPSLRAAGANPVRALKEN
jgi:putative ABC transport system permease protein